MDVDRELERMKRNVRLQADLRIRESLERTGYDMERYDQEKHDEAMAPFRAIGDATRKFADAFASMGRAIAQGYTRPGDVVDVTPTEGELLALRRFRHLGVQDATERLDQAARMEAAGVSDGLVDVVAKVAASGRMTGEDTLRMEREVLQVRALGARP